VSQHAGADKCFLRKAVTQVADVEAPPEAALPMRRVHQEHTERLARFWRE